MQQEHVRGGPTTTTTHSNKWTMDANYSPVLSPSCSSSLEEDGCKYGNYLLQPTWGLPDSPPSTRKAGDNNALESPRNNKLFGNWVQDKDGGVRSYWDQQGTSSILFSPLIPKTALPADAALSLSLAAHIPVDNHEPALQDEDGGPNDGLPPFQFDFAFDSDGDEEDEDEVEMGDLYNNHQLATRLGQMGYPLGLCYQAVEKYGSNMDAALNWLRGHERDVISSSGLSSSSSSTIASTGFTPSSSSGLSSSNPWVTYPPSSGGGVPDASSTGEYTYSYTHNVKNNTKLINSLSLTSPPSKSLLSSSVGFNPFQFSPAASINDPYDLAPDFYDLSKKQLCRYFLSGYCKNGDKCNFLHTAPSTTPPPSQPIPTVVGTPNSALHTQSPSTATLQSATNTCRYYTLGTCRKGANCPYLHTAPISPPSTPPHTTGGTARAAAATGIPFPSLLSPAPAVANSSFPLPVLHSTPSAPTAPSSAASGYPFLSPCPSPSPSQSPSNSPARSPSPSTSAPSSLPYLPGWDTYDFPASNSNQLDSLRHSNVLVQSGSSLGAGSIPSLSSSTPIGPPSGTSPRHSLMRSSSSNKQEAQRYFRIGIRHYHECEFEKALHNFRQSYQLYPSKESTAMIKKTLEFKHDEEDDEETVVMQTEHENMRFSSFFKEEAKLESESNPTSGVVASTLDRSTSNPQTKNEKHKLPAQTPITSKDNKVTILKKDDHKVAQTSTSAAKESVAHEKREAKREHDKKEKDAIKEYFEQERREREAKERRDREQAELERRERAEQERREKAEQERKEKERKEKERAEARERKEKEKAEREAKERERVEAANREKAENDRREKERRDKEKLEAEKKEKERLEVEKKERELKEKKEKERLEAERKEKERIEAEKKREAREKKEKERLEAEKREREKAEAERKERERADKERREKKEKERLEAERKSREEKERLEAEKRAKEEEKAKHDSEREHKDQDSSFGVAGVPGKAEFSSDLLPDLISDDETTAEDRIEKDSDGEGNDEDDMAKAVARIRAATDYYETLDVPRDASADDILAKYKEIMQLLRGSNNGKGTFPSPLSSVVKKVSQAYTFLSDPQKRVEYDALLEANSTSAHSSTYAGGFFDSARMFMSMVVLAVIALALFLKQAFTSIGRAVWPPYSRKGEAWCSSCRKYHPIAPSAYDGDENDGSDGSFWEEDGRYYFLQGSTKHDVTSFVQERYWTRGSAGHVLGDGCQFCRARNRLDGTHRHARDGSQLEEDKSKSKKKTPTPPVNNTANTNASRKSNNKRKKVH